MVPVGTKEEFARPDTWPGWVAYRKMCRALNPVSEGYYLDALGTLNEDQVRALMAKA